MSQKIVMACLVLQIRVMNEAQLAVYGWKTHHKIISWTQRLHAYCNNQASFSTDFLILHSTIICRQQLDTKLQLFVLKLKIEWVIVTWISEEKWTRRLNNSQSNYAVRLQFYGNCINTDSVLIVEVTKVIPTGSYAISSSIY